MLPMKRHRSEVVAASRRLETSRRLEKGRPVYSSSWHVLYDCRVSHGACSCISALVKLARLQGVSGYSDNRQWHAGGGFDRRRPWLGPRNKKGPPFGEPLSVLRMVPAPGVEFSANSLLTKEFIFL